MNIFSAKFPSKSTQIRLSGMSRFLTLVLMAILICPTSAFANFGRCCMHSAREQLLTLQMLPWDACGINQTSNINPLVNSTMAWCQHNCGGFELSKFNQWSDLLTTFVAPALALLVLCPVGRGKGEEEEVKSGDINKSATENPAEKPKNIKNFFSGKMIYLIREYTAILGDPAGAISGCFYQLFVDLSMVRYMSQRTPSEKGLEEDVRAFIILSGQTKVKELVPGNPVRMVKVGDLSHLAKLVKDAIMRTGQAPDKGQALQAKGGNEGQVQAVEAIGQATAESSNAATPLVIDIEKRIASTSTPNPPPLEDLKEAYAHSEFRRNLLSKMQILLRAKIGFVNGVGIPVVLTFAGTAAGFYGAYTVLGDRDKSYSLAYGVLFAWLLILSVVSNCYATTVNPALLEDALNELMLFCTRDTLGTPSQEKFRFIIVPFRKRIRNFVIWKAWLRSMTLDEQQSLEFNTRFFVTFLFMQTLGWLCVSVFIACAILIAYNTPTVGIGCRSFTFILYCFISLGLSWLLVIRELVSHMAGKKVLKKHICYFLKGLYGLGVFLNAFVLVGGTLFHLIGLYRSCRCQLLFGSHDALVVLSTNTQQDMDNARKYWIPVGYVAFTFAWLVCGVAIGIREYIYLHLKTRFDV